MSWSVLLLSASAAGVLLLAVLKLGGGGGRGDPMAPPKPKPRRLTHKELDDMTELVGRGSEAEARRRLKSAGYDDAATGRLIWWMTRVADADRDSARR